jgi:tellurite resistance protein
MTEHDGITSDVRSREDEYFRRKDRELVERMRQEAAAQQARQDLEKQSGIHDPALLQELEALGFTPDTVSLLPLVPIVQVAWAEGGVSEDERRLILQLARQRGVEPGSAADQKLAAWLKTQPAEVVFERATRLIRAMLDDQSGERKNLKVEDLIHHCEEIAAASGGVLGFRKISAEERALLGQIEAALKSK